MTEGHLMSEPVGREDGAIPDAAEAAQAGRLIRQAREATGLHVAALAVALKVPVAKLEALESGQLDLLPDVAFARALAATVCRNLKLDPAPVLAHLPPTGVSRLGAEEPAINTTFHASGAGSGLSLLAQLRNPVVVSVLALLLAAAAVLLWPKAAPLADDAALPAQATEASGQPMASLPAPETSAPVAPSVPVAPPVAAPAAVPVPLAPVSAPVPGQVPVAAVAAVLASPEGAAVPLVFTAKAECWVKVTDAKGVVSLGRTLKPGEVAEVTGSLPMALVVGRADAVDLQVNGQAFDMARFPKDRAARFEVK
jgi:cytoskeleton protein RodZ